MKIEEIRTYSDEELAKKLEASGKELMDLRFKLATRQLANHREFGWVKKDIARMLTIKSERERGITGAEKA